MTSLEMSNPVLTSITSAPDLSKLRVYNGSPSNISINSSNNNSTPPEPMADSAVISDDEQSVSSRRKLQWEFKGLTLWLELEEFDNDLTDAVSNLSLQHNSPLIPKPHTTAIYGMTHLSDEQAVSKLRSVRQHLDQWPTFAKPTGVTQDIAQMGRPGQVCSIAWSELTLSSDDRHEEALDTLYALFYDDESSSHVARTRPWKPHNSIAYDNPEDNALSLLDTVLYASRHPTLLGKERRVEAISLWSTEGKMEDWECLDRVKFW